MNFALITNLKKLVAFLKAPFALEAVPEILETIAKIFRDSLSILEVFKNPPAQSAENQFLTDEEVIQKVEELIASHESETVNSTPANLGLSEILLIVSLIRKVLNAR